MHHYYFPPVIQALQEEIQQHPDLLVNMLQLPKGAAIEEKLGEVAAYCEIALDGYYGEDDILKLCDILVARLKKKRGELVLEIVSSLPPSMIQ